MTHLDLRCKAGLQKMLRPSNYDAIRPWLASATDEEKRDMANLAQVAEDHAKLGKARGSAPANGQVLTNKHGRSRLPHAVIQTADRAQHDLLRATCGADIRDEGLERQRRKYATFAAVPSCSSVHDYHRLAVHPVNGPDGATKALTERARKGLDLWQLRGPDDDKDAAARAMRSLRSLNSIIASMPTNADTQVAMQGLTVSDRLHESSKLGPRWPPPKMQHSRSAPAVHIRPPPEPEDYSTIARPGGYVVSLVDTAKFMGAKNRSRSITSKIPVTGGARDWTTSSGTMAAR